MMKAYHYVFCAAIAGSVFLLDGCAATIRELPKEQLKAMTADKELALSRDLLMAFLKNDGKKFISLLPENLSKEFTLEKFKATRDYVVQSAGEPISFQYVTKLELTTFTPHIWKVRFKRMDRTKKKEFTSELLFRVITGKMDNKPIITSFHFI